MVRAAQFLTLKLFVFLPRKNLPIWNPKSPYLGPQSPYQKLQISLFEAGGARWLSGRVSDSGARGRGSIPTAAVLCPWARHFTPRKYWLITQEAVAPSPHDWKIVDWDVKPQHNQPTYLRPRKYHMYVLTWLYTLSFLNIQTPKKFVVITLKFELCGSTIE